MGQGADDDYSSLFSSPLWITDGVGIEGAGSIGSASISTGITGWGTVCSHGAGSGNSDGSAFEKDGGDDQVDINKTFLDTETLSSLSNFTYPSSHGNTGTATGTVTGPDIDARTPVRKRTHVTSSIATITTANVEDPFTDQTSYNGESFMSFSTGTGTGVGTDKGTRGPQQPRDSTKDTFLLSRQTSAATMAMTTSPIAATEATSNANLPPSFSHLLFDSPSQTRCQEPDLDPLEQDRGSENLDALGIRDYQRWQREPKQHHDYELFNDLDFDHLFPDTFLNQAALEHRPSSSRSHIRYWPHNSKGSIADAARLLRISSDESSPVITDRPSMALSREEFEALPPTIQRKYFSTLERLRFVSPDSLEAILPRSADHDQTWSRPSTSTKHSKRSKQPNSSHSSNLRAHVNPTDHQFYANLPEKIRRGHLTEEEQIVAELHRRSVILDAADEAFIKIGRRHSEGLVEPPLMSPGLSEGKTSTSSMHSRQGTKASQRPTTGKKTDSFYDSFRWLEEDDDLDLRLHLDDYHFNLREDVPLPTKSRRPSFRRHLSINKLPFGRPSITQSRPGTTTDEAAPPPFFTSTTPSPAIGSVDNIHGRKKSRALSLISANRQPAPDPSTPFDPTAAHYQDPEARMKLKVYLASPQKFDEAIEFGFPSMDGLRTRNEKIPKVKETRTEKQLESNKLRTFLEDDLSSSDSDDVSLAEPDSPKTPELFEKHVPARQIRVSTDRANPRGEYAHAPALSREMTLRMTLTRPDLRSSEEQIYGWKQANAARGIHSRDDSRNPVIFARDGNSKESIEKQLAALDHWDDNNNNNNTAGTTETGVVKRFWNRMKWT